MTSVEAVQPGVGYQEGAIEQVAVRADEAVDSPSRPADAELTLRSMNIYLPDGPLSINGKPFSVSVDEEKLTAAVNKVAEFHVGREDLYPRQVVVDLTAGQSTVELGEDLQPKITKPEGAKQEHLLRTFKDGGTAVTITLPSELASSEYSDSGLVELLTRQANKDLLIALGQNLQARRKFRAGLRVSSLVLVMAAGEGAGIAISDTWDQMLGRGAGGALVGGALAVGALLAANRARWGDMNNLPAWTIRKSRDYQKIHWQLEDTAKQGPIISINEQVEAEQ